MTEDESAGRRSGWRTQGEDDAGTSRGQGPDLLTPIPAPRRPRMQRVLRTGPLRWAAATALLGVVALLLWGPGRTQSAGSGPTTTDNGFPASPETLPTTPTTAPAQRPPATAPPPTTAPVPMGTAPLTGLPAPLENLPRPALVSKIDASLPAMPQLGLELADIVYEVKIEWGSRYLGVWHSQDAEVIGPQRSARTTDPDLLGMFGHPLFAYSGSNPGVGLVLGAATWKTDVRPGMVRGAYYRDLSRPWHNSLMARTEQLRETAGSAGAPSQLFDYHLGGATPPGMPVSGFTSYPGVLVGFRWDPAVRGWRRQIWQREHVHADGSPVAPTNVVVLETAYPQSQVDERSPEAASVGFGRAWAFSEGRVRSGTWARAHRHDRWNLRDPAGAPITLSPGTTWVVLAEGRPTIEGPS